MTTRQKMVEELKSKLPPLISSIQSGDRSLDNEFAKLLLPYIRRVVYKYKETIDENINGLADYIVVKLLSKINDIDLNKPVLSYITRTAINQAIDQHRKYTSNKSNCTVLFNEQAVELNAQSTYNGSKAIFNSTDTVEYTHKDQSATLSGYSVNSLDNFEPILNEYLCKEEVDLIQMYYLDNKTTSEIASITGKSLIYTSNAIQNAKQNLIRAVNE
jgi:RNA polymerase sigma factor (sigma-70 family)